SRFLFGLSCCSVRCLASGLRVTGHVCFIYPMTGVRPLIHFLFNLLLCMLSSVFGPFHHRPSCMFIRSVLGSIYFHNLSLPRVLESTSTIMMANIFFSFVCFSTRSHLRHCPCCIQPSIQPNDPNQLSPPHLTLPPDGRLCV